MPKRNSILTGTLSKIFFYIGLIALWELTYQIGVNWLGIWKPYAFPSPINVFKSIVFLTANKTLPIAIATSMKRILIGYSTSVLIGSFIGILIVKFKYLDDNLSPLILGLQTLPSICWLPFAILWFGLGESAIDRKSVV